MRTNVMTSQKLQSLASCLRLLAEDCLCQSGWLAFNVAIDSEFLHRIGPIAAFLEGALTLKKEVGIMLSLRRKIGERIFIILEDGRRIELQVGKISASGTLIHIDAPRSIEIYRAEVTPAVPDGAVSLR